MSPGIISDSMKKAFLSQLSACGIDPSKSSGVPVLTATARVTASSVLLIADFGTAMETGRIFMVEIPRAAVPVSSDSSLAPRLRKELLWQQERRISSAVEWHDSSTTTKEDYLFLLSEGFFVRMRFENNALALSDSTELPKPERSSRGGSGIFVGLAVLMSPKLCSFEPIGSLSFRCSSTNIGGKASTISSPCDQATHILWTDRGDYTQRDRIIFEGTEVTGPALTENEIPSRSVEVPGPVLDISNGDDPKTATAVVRNLSTGNYEVYRITAVCSD